MADESTQSIVVDAPAEEIMAVIADFPAYPEWAKAFTKAEVLTRGADARADQVAFTIESGPFKDSYTLAYTWTADGLTVDWTLVKGQMQRAQKGRYQLTPESDRRTKVTYTLSVELAVPMIGLFRRKAEKMIMDTALKELKRRVERD
ncbi:SRPBCC family protein [Actinokineospora auranticolor]|uniref:Ribosome-associated toxin RatA of RatAB toxin-antitoxin module n=1 Tax=Actinokineospora auranticolor TaxID=155976 RepID=A0A2S6GG64_9PSEU|nr:SRPBCC family protein [Actinokineospora auranticolor]PPK64183.1 ribosome-associated toxin RatA of RatAB toxin-antitoxin module [Actinokineospora auranticolor]